MQKPQKEKNLSAITLKFASETARKNLSLPGSQAPAGGPVS